MKKCPNCGAQMNDDSLFCTECGSKILQGNVCPYCGASMNDGDVFCQNCGKKPNEAVLPSLSSASLSTCPYCGVTMSDDDVFCQNCGNKREGFTLQSSSRSTPSYNVMESSSNYKKIIVLIIVGVIVLALISGGWWYFNSSKAPQSNNEIAVSNSIAADTVVAEAVEEDIDADTLVTDTLAVDVSPFEQALNAYEPILDKYIAKGESNNHWEEYYFLHDVTGDGIPELWLQVNGGDSYNLLAFTYKDGQTKQISSIDVGHPSHHTFYRGSDYILMVFAHMGSSSWTKYEYKNGKIQGKEIFSETLSEEDENAEYKEPSETAISPIEITNKQELHNIVY